MIIMHGLYSQPRFKGVLVVFFFDQVFLSLMPFALAGMLGTLVLKNTVRQYLHGCTIAGEVRLFFPFFCLPYRITLLVFNQVVLKHFAVISDVFARNHRSERQQVPRGRPHSSSVSAA